MTYLMISENKTKGKHKKCDEQLVLGNVSNVYLRWSWEIIITRRVQGDVHFNFITVHFTTLTPPAMVVKTENNIIEMKINTSPLVIGSFNVQMHLYVKLLMIWHRNHIPGQLKGPHQLIQDDLR